MEVDSLLSIRREGKISRGHHGKRSLLKNVCSRKNHRKQQRKRDVMNSFWVLEGSFCQKDEVAEKK